MSAWREKLEAGFARGLGLRGAVAAGFGRAALWLALEASDVAGGEVAVPEFVCAQVPDAVRRAGAWPAFYRVRRDLTVDPAALEAAITPRTRAAVVVHYFGRVQPEMKALAEVCRLRGVPCIEDCALAFGASAGSRRAGTFGAAAVFSFTKSDACYGGGMVASDSEQFLARVHALRVQRLQPAGRLLFCYGLLRRADFIGNRPRYSGAAWKAGLWLQRLCLPGAKDFYDAGRFEAAMSDFAARRALRILSELRVATARRRRILGQLYAALRAQPQILLRPDLVEGDAGTFLLLVSPQGRALDWVKEAGLDSVALRYTWPAYQDAEPGQDTQALEWWAEHVPLLEVHPRLSEDEIERIAKTIVRLAREGRV
jgi:dTDP-4-amino-4,6-dideoxygalactose transaminase